MKNFLLCAAIICSAMIAEAQVQTPAASPAASVTTVVGLTDVKIEYSRPRIKGRKIFGTDATVLVPYGKIWRSGANSGTRVTFSDDVTVEGVAVPKGTYLLLSWPGASEWTIALNKDLTLGARVEKYDDSKDAAKFKVKADKLTEKVEVLTFNIADISDDNKSAKIQLAWENTSVKFTVTTDFDKRVMESIAKSTKVDPYNYYLAAAYYMDTNRDLKQALEWVTKAADELGGPYWALYQKARIQKALGDKAGATASANASIEAAKKQNNADYQRMNEELIKSLK